MIIHTYQFPEDRYYEKHHLWAKVQNDLVVVGISDYAQHLAGEIIFFDAPRIGKTVAQNKPFASLESGKWVGRVYAPVSGIITAVNEVLEDDTSLINDDPYNQGWLVKIRPRDLAELNNLLKVDSAEFKDWFAQEIRKNS